MPLHVTQVEEELLTVQTDRQITDEATIRQTQHIVQPPRLLRELEQFWQTRWYNEQPPAQSDWHRITNFLTAFMPQGAFTFPPITVGQWRRTTRKFRTQAARGADGYNKEDITNMSDAQITAILSLFEAIEQANTTWPEQWLTSFVIALSKRDDPSGVNDYRPVVLLSILYRTWSSLRARQFLQQMVQWTPDTALGFMPGCETTQIWLTLQGEIELSLQEHSALGGIATDIVKAFEHIGRPQLFQLLAHIGVPSNITHPWSTFLSNFKRRFIIQTQLGRPCHSNIGLPEGCPLSVAGMAALDWAMHVYLQHFAPNATVRSFVDNISITATTVHAVATGFFALRSFFEAWGMDTDHRKTYTWGTQPGIRQQMGLLGFTTVQDAMELGGNLVFGAAQRNHQFLARGQGMEEAWQRLRRSRAPMAMKLLSLPAVFWSRALHAATISTFSPTHLGKLRTRAAQAIGASTAGANPLLRLSLSTPHTSDPGFFQLQHVIADFRRICHKTPSLLNYWRHFMVDFDGRLFSGPFSKLVLVLNQIGWSIELPPLVREHDGHLIDLLNMDHQGLQTLLWDAWLQFVAFEVRKRRTMQDLTGLDPELVMVDKSTMTALELSRTLALQEGAFLSAWSQAKFDNQKEAMCKQCMMPDTQSHWLRCPRHQQHHTDSLMLIVGGPPLKTALSNHLLPDRSPWINSFKKYFLELDSSWHWASQPGTGTQHVFVDGSCFPHIPTYATCAAWGALNATTGKPIASNPLAGISQTIGRAELTAALAAVTWTLSFACDTWLWTDSKYVANIIDRILQGDPAFPTVTMENHDLINTLWETMQELAPGQLRVTWIPSHLDPQHCDEGYEQWVAFWNGAADVQAVTCNRTRTPDFWQMVHLATEYHQDQTHIIRELRHFYWQIGEETRPSFSGTDNLPVEIIGETDWDEVVGFESFYSKLPPLWQQTIQYKKKDPPGIFIEDLLQTLCRWDDAEAPFLPLSFIELALLLREDSALRLPQPSVTRGVQLARPSDFFSRPTLAKVVDLIRGAFRVLVDHFGLDFYWAHKQNRSHLGIFMPADCIILRVSSGHRARLHDLVSTFTAHRGFRKAADLAKPV